MKTNFNIQFMHCSEDQTQREREKNKLEKAYKESDRKLDKFLQGCSRLDGCSYLTFFHHQDKFRRIDTVIYHKFFSAFRTSNRSDIYPECIQQDILKDHKLVHDTLPRGNVARLYEKFLMRF